MPLRVGLNLPWLLMNSRLRIFADRGARDSGRHYSDGGLLVKSLARRATPLFGSEDARPVQYCTVP